MEAVLHTLTNGFPYLALHLVTVLFIFFTVLGLYTVITPIKERKLIKEGNTAASISYGAATLSLALPLGVCLSDSINFYDILFWGLAILGVQLVLFFGIDLLVKETRKSIEKGEISAAVHLASLKIAVSILIAFSIAA